MKIKECEINSLLRVTGYERGSRPYRQKLLAMGLVKGAELQMTRVAPLGDPVEVKINNNSLTLRKAEADALEVEEVE